MTDTVTVPVVALSLAIFATGVLITYAGSNSRLNAIESSMIKLDEVVREVSDEALANHKGVALNDQAIKMISEALDKQHQTQKETAVIMEDKLQTLIEVMLNKN